MPFNNDIAGGNGQLVRNWIQSVNYVAGVSGWRISKDGSAEFNNGTFRGSIEVGPNPGKHFFVNNPGTGDVVDIYDNGNNLVYSIDSNGSAASIGVGFPNTPTVTVGLGGIAFSDSLTVQSGEVTIGEAVGSTLLRVSSPVLIAGGTALNLELVAPSAAGGSYALLDSHGTTGTVMQNDSNNGSNCRFHVGTYSGTTDASGFLFPNHGASFTPVAGVMTGTTAGGTFANLTYGLNAFNATQMSVNFHVANTGAAYANQAISFDVIMWG